MTWAEMYPSSATVSDDLEEKETTSWTSQGRGGR